MKQKKFQYHISCVSASGRSIMDMQDAAREITFETFRRKVENLSEFSKNLGYDRCLKIQDDYAVSFYKSKYRGKPCYYLRHSSIEYIFI